jgi:DNA relaxase NicK
MALSESQVLSVGVDWLSCTTKAKESGQRMQSLAAELLHGQQQSGNTMRPFSLAGFEGLKCGQLQCGTRGTECLVRISGELARTDWRPFCELAENVSRLDLQCTSDNGRSALERIRHACGAAKRSKAATGWTNAITYIACDDGGHTLYIGKRSSERLGRVYVARFTHGEQYPHEAVRAELELKGSQAWSMAQRLLKSNAEGVLISQCLSSFIQAEAC